MKRLGVITLPGEFIEKIDPHKLQQWIKWTVYSLLIINFIYYVWDDWDAASHELDASADILDWMRMFATTIDELAWFVLLAMFELETYVLTEEKFKGAVKWSVHTARFICYIMIFHTIFAYGTSVYNNHHHVRPVPASLNICKLADGKTAYLENLEYTLITDENCASLTSGEDLYFMTSGESVISDSSGLLTEQRLAWLDFIQAIAWILIMFLIEFNIRDLEKENVSTNSLRAQDIFKYCFYGILFYSIFVWIYKGHYIYSWDQFLWICGFAAIEFNMVEWREEVLQEMETASTQQVRPVNK